MLRFFGWLISIVIIGLITAGAAVMAILYYYGMGLPDYKQLASYTPPIVTRLYAGDGQVFAEYAYEKRIYVPLTAIPPLVKNAFLSAEDKNFYHHYGIDVASIISASLKNLAQLGSSKRPKGASTITQQVAKNFLLSDISNSVSYERKIKEAILSFRIENAYSKDYIFELYLNAVYLGSGSYGVAAAALTYFNKSLDELTPSEAAFLAVLPKAPSRYHPTTNRAQTLGRRDWVLGRMYEDGHITKPQLQQAQLDPLHLSERSARGIVHANYFAEEVRRDLIKRLGEKTLYQDGYVVRTTLDPKLQRVAEQTLCQGLINYDRSHGWRGALLNLPHITSTSNWVEALKNTKLNYRLGSWQIAVVLALTNQEAKIGLLDGHQATITVNNLRWARRWLNDNAKGPAVLTPHDVLRIGDVIMVEAIDNTHKNFQLQQIPSVSGAIVVIEPQTGRVLALQGGFDFNLSQFNRATQAMRQTGSAFKPFVCLAALEAGLTPNTIVYDEPFAVDLGYNLGIYRPHNWDDEFKGPLTLRRSFELSRNVSTIRMVYEKVGMKRVVQIAKRFNIDPHMPRQLSSILGASETTVLQLTTAYAMLANGGKLVVPRFFDHIQDRYGKTVLVNAHFDCQGCSQDDWQHLPYLKDLRPNVTDPILTYQLTSILMGAVQRGTATLLKDLNYPIAVKSGTTNDFKDAWMVGYTADLVVGVFVGFDQPRSLGHKQFGAVVAGPIFKSFMEQALLNRPNHEFTVPAHTNLVPVNLNTGEITSASDTDVVWEALKSDETTPLNLGDEDESSVVNADISVHDPWKAVPTNSTNYQHLKDEPEQLGDPVESAQDVQGIY